MDVLDAVGGLVRVARFALAGSLISSIERQTDIARFGHALAVKSRHLLLHSAVRVRHDEGGIAFRRVIVRRRIDVGGDFQTAEVVGNGMDINLTVRIFRERAGIDQPPRIRVVALESGHIRHCK